MFRKQKKLRDEKGIEGRSTKIKLGAFFRDQRIERGVSPKTVADYLGVSTKVIEDYESGRVKIPTSHAYAISNCLNISPEIVMWLLRRGCNGANAEEAPDQSFSRKNAA